MTPLQQCRRDMHLALDQGDLQRFYELRAEYRRAMGYGRPEHLRHKQHVPNAKQVAHELRERREVAVQDVPGNEPEL